MKDDGANKPDLHTWSSMRRTTGGQNGRISTRESNDGGRNPQSAPVKFNVKDDGDKKAGCAHVNLGVSAVTGAL